MIVFYTIFITIVVIVAIIWVRYEELKINEINEWTSESDRLARSLRQHVSETSLSVGCSIATEQVRIHDNIVAAEQRLNRERSLRDAYNDEFRRAESNRIAAIRAIDELKQITTTNADALRAALAPPAGTTSTEVGKAPPATDHVCEYCGSTGYKKNDRGSWVCGGCGAPIGRTIR